MTKTFEPERRSWPKKFADAFVGVAQGIRGQRSFTVHIPVGIAAIVGGIALQLSLVEMVTIVVCVTLVLAAELFNSALEQLARAVTNEFDVSIERALNIASGAVLVTSVGAAVIGVLLFAARIWQLAGF